jgi:hypothetical protein
MVQAASKLFAGFNVEDAPRSSSAARNGDRAQFGIAQLMRAAARKKITPREDPTASR